ncbi:site-specific integrase [Crenobacter cavernae]|uniref:Site-specific integrase n=1 Tax=Crenobacter cavernae TaxID=2290923 RepID=A0ABY0FAE5_9NEIS|nr:site-specific integrase [Crenobacter cavernae]
MNKPLPALLPSTDLARQRAPGAALIGACDDAEAVALWLAEHHDSPRTLASYRKETERFLLWLAERGRGLSGVLRDDVLAYQAFLADPQPAWRWVGPSRPREHAEWKPFGGPLSPGSVRHSVTVLGALFAYLNDAAYLAGNPFRLKKRRQSAVRTTGAERHLDKDCWQTVLTTLDALPADTARERDHAERARWLFALLYLSGARRSEIADAKMGDWFERRGRWWWRIHGKGGVTADVPVADSLFSALTRYRARLGLAARPLPGEDVPLVCRVTGRGARRFAPLSDKAIYLIVKTVFARAAETAPADKRETLLAATTHWLRHTAASHQLDAGVPLLLVSQNLRHASLQTTRRYLHSEDDARHEASRGLDWRPAEP